MPEANEGQPKSAGEIQLPPEKLKSVLSELQKKFNDAFEKSRNHPLWHQAPSGITFDSYVSEYVSDKEKWRVSSSSNSLQLKRYTLTPDGEEIDEVDLRNDNRVTWLGYDKIVPDKNDSDKRQRFHTGDTPLAVKMVENLISELPQHKD